MDKVEKLVAKVAEQIREMDCEVGNREFDVEQTLRERERILNSQENWTWNEKNKKRFVQINNALYRHCKKGWDIATKKARLFEKQMAEGSAFFDDYEIKILITPYVSDLWKTRDDVDEETREDVSTYLSEECAPFIEMNISHTHYDNCVKGTKIGKELFISKKWNWNTEYLGEYFKDEHICYAIHCLLDTGAWSFGDICSINKIFVDVKVVFQYCEEVPLLEEWRNEDEIE